MKRYLLTSLLIGLTAAMVALALYFLRIYESLASRLDLFYRANGFYPGGQSERMVWAEALSIVVLATWICWCLGEVIEVSQKLMIVAVALLTAVGISPTLALYGKFFEPFSSLSALLMGAGAAFAFSASELGNRRRILELVLGRRVSRKTFDELMSARQAPSFESRKREVSLLTCRLFNRAELASSLAPGDFLLMANHFRRVLIHYLAQQGAYLDEAGPELVRAYFGLLRDEKDHAVRAARAALGIRECLRQVGSEARNRWSEELRAGVGISSGTAISGIYGSKEHFFLSAIGPETDFSRRLSRANLVYGSDILVGPGTYRLIADVAELRPMEMFYDPESGSLREIYQLLAMKEDFSEDQRQLRDAFWQGVIRHREGKYKEALEAFQQARVPGRRDEPLEYFIRSTQEKWGVSRSPASPKSPHPAGPAHSRLLDNL